MPASQKFNFFNPLLKRFIFNANKKTSQTIVQLVSRLKKACPKAKTAYCKIGFSLFCFFFSFSKKYLHIVYLLPYKHKAQKTND